jgi:hypothetical protein
MIGEKSLRKHLVDLLTKERAHVGFEAAVKGLPAALRGKRPKGAAHSPWEIVEHMRIAQWDILEFCRNPRHVSPNFPQGYWPISAAPPSARAWNKSIAAFRADLAKVVALARDESVDLFVRIPHGDGQTILREILLVADHNAYHLGQLAVVRRLLGAWR